MLLNLKTAIDSATDPNVRRAYLSVVADVNGTTIQQVMRDFNCTEPRPRKLAFTRACMVPVNA